MTIDDCNSYLDNLSTDAPGSPKKFTVIVERRDKLVYEDEYSHFCTSLKFLHSDLPYKLESITVDDARDLINLVKFSKPQLFEGTKAEREKLKKVFKNFRKQQASINQETLYKQLFFGVNNEERHSDEA